MPPLWAYLLSAAVTFSAYKLYGNGPLIGFLVIFFVVGIVYRIKKGHWF